MKLLYTSALISAALTSAFIIACSGKSSSSKAKDVRINETNAREGFNASFKRLNPTSKFSANIKSNLTNDFDSDVRIGMPQNYDRADLLDAQGRKQIVLASYLGGGAPQFVLNERMDTSLYLSQGNQELKLITDGNYYCLIDIAIPLYNSDNIKVGALKQTTTVSFVGCKDLIITEEGKQKLADGASGEIKLTADICNNEFASVCSLDIEKGVSLMGDIIVTRMQLVVK